MDTAIEAGSPPHLRKPKTVLVRSHCGTHQAEIFGPDDLAKLPWIQPFLRRPGFRRLVVDRQDPHLISAEYDGEIELFVGRMDPPLRLPKGKL